LIVTRHDGVCKVGEQGVGGKGVREKLMERAGAESVMGKRATSEPDLSGKRGARLLRCRGKLLPQSGDLRLSIDKVR
jgi:hypothetical protein